MDGQLTTGFLSRHLGSGGEKFNENNIGLGYITPSDWMFGAYKNSINKPSLYAAKRLSLLEKEIGEMKFGAGGLLGAVTGYGKPLMPVVMPEVTAGIDGNTLALGFVPKTRVTPATLALQYRARF